MYSLLFVTLILMGCGKASQTTSEPTSTQESISLATDVDLTYKGTENSDTDVLKACATPIAELTADTIPMTVDGDNRTYYFDTPAGQKELKTTTFSANTIMLKHIDCTGFRGSIWGRSLGKTDGGVRIQVFRPDNRTSAHLVFLP